MSELELINLVASSERTPQLAEYWTKRYTKFLEEKLFVISEKTQNLLTQKEAIHSPTTPFGHIDLLRFVNKNNGLEEVALQNSVETAIRFLDSCIETIDFGNDARQVVIEFRKIGLGVIGFEEYLIAKNSTSKEDEINYLGNIISGSAYRASEALAEEKGVCGKWNSIKIELRPKPFEFWYDTVTGDIKNGLELMEDFEQSNIEESNFEIIPRRNSHILLYPIESSWQLWSDRDEATTPKIKAEEGQIQNKISKEEIVELKSEKSFEPTFNEKKLKGLDSTKKLSGFASVINSGKKVVHEWFKDEDNAEVMIENNLNKSVGQIESMFSEDSQEQTDFKKDQINTKIINTDSTEENIAKFAFRKNLSPSNAPLIDFTINDIVKVINKKSELFDNIFQIHDIEFDEESSVYQITLDSKDGLVVRESEIEKLTITQLLTDSKVLTKVTAAGVIFSQDGQKVALQKSTKTLPQITNCDIKQSLDTQLVSGLQKLYNLVTDFSDISAIVVKQNSIVVSYILNINSDKISSELDWFGLHEVYDDESRNLVTTSVEKTKRLQNTIKAKANELLKENLVEQTKVLEADYQQKIIDQKQVIANEVKTSYESLIKDLKYKLQEKTKEYFDTQELAKSEKSLLDSKINELEKSKNSIINENTKLLTQSKATVEIEVQNITNQLDVFKKTNVKLETENEELKLEILDCRNNTDEAISKSNDFRLQNENYEEEIKVLNDKLNELELQISSLLSQIKEIESQLIEKEKIIQFSIIAHEKQLATIQSQVDTKHDEYLEYIQKLNLEHESNLSNLNENLKLKDEEVKDSLNNQKLEIVAISNQKDEIYNSKLTEIKSKYENEIEELNLVLKSKQSEIRNLSAAKDNELKLALDEQNKVRLDLEQMCLARVEQQKEAETQYQKVLTSRFENQSQVLATKYDADIRKQEDELRNILVQKENEHKTNLNRQKQYYEDLIKKMSFASAESFESPQKSKAIKILVEESDVTFQSKDVINHSNDEIFHQTRENLFKPNMPLNTPIIAKVNDDITTNITHSQVSKNITTKEDTLNTLLRMKGIVARK